MRTISIAARAYCLDGPVGETVTVVVNPESSTVTHVVVQDADDVQRLVPISRVTKSGRDHLGLACTKAELAAMEPFVTTRYVKTEHVEYSSAYSQPYLMAVPVSDYKEVEVEHVPPDEVAVRRGMQVEASDGHIGSVSGLLLDPAGAYITHAIVQTGRFRGKQEVMIPLSAIDRVFDGTVYLTIDKKTIAALPAIPVKRRSETVADEKQVEMVARIFTTADGAEKGLEFVKGLQRQGVARLLNAATLVKDAEGKVHVKETKDMDARQGRRFGAIAGGLLGLLAGPGGLIIGALVGAGTGGVAANRIDKGFSDRFLNAFQERLQPGNSALVILVEHQWLHSLAEATAELEGIVLQETLSDELIQQFTEAPGIGT